MQYGVTLPAFVEWSDPRVVTAMAAEAEAAGWDAFFLWDHVTWNPEWGGTPPMADPWLCLAAAATRTSRVLLGTMVTPLARRRPQVVAREVVTLDQLSDGRAVLGVGLGEDFEFAAYGEPVTQRGARLDEALDVLVATLSGEAVDFDGDHFTVHSPPSLPTPVNGSVPIWVGGHWPNPAPFERARRFDGVVPRKAGPPGSVLTTDDLRDLRAAVGRDDDFAYVASGNTAGADDAAVVGEWEAAGATWWLESAYPFGGRAAAMRERIQAGPPRA
jgi:alkanesulfonate monooxygenase SsuD/methylene tetrahydromethanopterin reductase-like flavin-dependent oxidoreductase (luciferase family)